MVPPVSGLPVGNSYESFKCMVHEIWIFKGRAVIRVFRNDRDTHIQTYSGCLFCLDISRPDRLSSRVQRTTFHCPVHCPEPTMLNL